jgi:hypothetical protein
MMLRYCVLGGLDPSSPDDLPSRLPLEDRWLLGEGIDALPRLCGGLLDHNDALDVLSPAARKGFPPGLMCMREVSADAGGLS